jgi:hypothetical protein
MRPQIVELYIWLHGRQPESFPDIADALQSREMIVEYITESLDRYVPLDSDPPREDGEVRRPNSLESAEAFTVGYAFGSFPNR